MGLKGTKRRVAGYGRRVCLAVLAACFLGGVFLGQVLPIGEETGGELRRYLSAYVALETQARPGWVQTILLYLRYPLLAFGLGFFPAGGALVCALSTVFGFFLSYAVSCFAVALGPDGVLLALAVMGVRCVVTLPCFLWLGVSVMERASFGRGRGSACWLRLGAVLPVLLLGVCVDLLALPSLVEWLLKWIVI